MSEIENLLSSVESHLRKQIKPIAEHYREIYLASYCLRSKTNLRDLSFLIQKKSYRGASHFTCEQINIFAHALLFCSDLGTFALAQMQWHDELGNRLRYLNLEALQMEIPRLDTLLKRVDTDEGQKLLIGWFKEKPQSPNAKAAWLTDWTLWTAERLLTEINVNWVESPRQRKEVAIYAEFMHDHRPSLTVRGAKHFVLLDEEINAATFLEDEESVRFEHGPMGLCIAATLDFLSLMDDYYHLNLHDAIESLRLKHNAGEFK